MYYIDAYTLRLLFSLSAMQEVFGFFLLGCYLLSGLHESLRIALQRNVRGFA
eukprot:m.26520 g.26520  ORF g.26520 m.26520 type:complete len:52 (-) comp8836_c0_seq1:133-288(-)